MGNLRIGPYVFVSKLWAVEEVITAPQAASMSPLAIKLVAFCEFAFAQLSDGRPPGLSSSLQTCLLWGISIFLWRILWGLSTLLLWRLWSRLWRLWSRLWRLWRLWNRLRRLRRILSSVLISGLIVCQRRADRIGHWRPIVMDRTPVRWGVCAQNSPLRT